MTKSNVNIPGSFVLLVMGLFLSLLLSSSCFIPVSCVVSFPISDLAISKTGPYSVELDWCLRNYMNDHDGAPERFDQYEIKVFKGEDMSGQKMTGLKQDPPILDMNSTKAEISGLSHGQTYTFVLQLTTLDGESLDSNPVVETTVAISPPARPRDPYPVWVTADSVILGWFPPANFGFVGETEPVEFDRLWFQFYEGTFENGTEVTPKGVFSSIPVGYFRYPVYYGFKADTMYSFKIFVSNKAGEVIETDEQSFTTLKPGEPTAPLGLDSFLLTGFDTGSADFEWDDSNDVAFDTHYRSGVKSGTTNGTTPANFDRYEMVVYEGGDRFSPVVPANDYTVSLDLVARTVTVSGLKPGTTYTFNLKHCNDVQLCTNSNFQTVTLK